ncbi:MAG: DUF2157 domain-containing protein [Cyanobacteriota/Melainabacteria group bacterium]|nr:DUF2157 domain-containing protein [Cyanobacteria bacterium HKST-UBA01]MCB9467305.1 DUF2157 domain-containing protein [Candidatus Obscuribacterales bacterium]
MTEDRSDSSSVGTKRDSLVITRQDLDWAESEGLVARGKASVLWEGLQSRHEGETKFNLLNIVWYGGSTMVILALMWILSLVAKTPQMLTVMSLAYMAGFAGIGWFLSRDIRTRVPGGLLTTLAVVMTPVVGLSLMEATNVSMMGTSQQFILELATIFAGVLALQFVRFPFITAPIYASLWFMAMTLTDSFLLGGLGWMSNQHLLVTIGFGSMVLIISYLVDRRTREDFSFWGYFFGMLMVWGAWSFMDRGGELGNFIYFLGNVAFMVASAMLRRKVFLVFGSIGAIWYLGYLAYDIFADSVMFPVALLAIGVGVIYSGIMYRKHGHKLENAIHSLVKK